MTLERLSKRVVRTVCELDADDLCVQGLTLGTAGLNTGWHYSHAFAISKFKPEIRVVKQFILSTLDLIWY